MVKVMKKVIQIFQLRPAKRIRGESFVRDNHTVGSYNYKKNGERIIRYYLSNMINIDNPSYRKFMILFKSTVNHEFIHHLVPRMKEGTLLCSIEGWFKNTRVKN